MAGKMTEFQGLKKGQAFQGFPTQSFRQGKNPSSSFHQGEIVSVFDLKMLSYVFGTC